jgi:hypothetical protein
LHYCIITYSSCLLYLLLNLFDSLFVKDVFWVRYSDICSIT